LAVGPAALRKAGFAPDRPTARSAEGLLAFLPPDAQDLPDTSFAYITATRN
jgi:O-methyltransferase involved in polyketide biosynthesis